jgi:NADPH:quinone reductase-like Zn-dependent oxidoreductase
MRAIRVHGEGGVEDLGLDEVEMPEAGPDEVLVRVHAAAITRNELEWPVDRLPAIPSYELSGTVVETGDEVFALTAFDRDGVAAEYAAVPASVLAPKPRTLGHVESAAIPLAGLSAWQGLFDHGGLAAGERVLIHGAAGGVGSFATQLAHRHGAYVIGTASGAGLERARQLGADAVFEYGASFEDALDEVQLVFDTVGGDVLARSAAVLPAGARLVSVAVEPPPPGTYFVVEPNRAQLVELAGLADEGLLRPAIDSVFPLAEARAAFERLSARGKSGKVVLRLVED